MTRLQLPSVTLVCADCLDVQRAVVVLEKCKALCDFGAVRLFTHLDTTCPHKVAIPALTTLSDYSGFMLNVLHQYVGTEHMLVVQHDGWVMNPDAWNPAWLGYDYIGGLWIHTHAINALSVGSGGFSLRSRRLMAAVAQRQPEYTGQSGTESWPHEDGVICSDLRSHLVQQGFQFAPPEEASRFCQGGNRSTQYYVERPFGFHGMWANINQATGTVNKWPLNPCPGFAT